MLFDCASLTTSAAKRAKVIPEQISPEVSSSNKVCDDYSGDEDEGVQLNLMEMHSTPSPCCTPIVIYSSSDDESADHGCFADDDSHFLVHATPIPSECSSSSIFSTAGVGDLTDNSSSVDYVVSSIASSTNLLCTDSSNTTTVPKPISYRGNFSSGSGHGSPKDIAQSPCFPPA